MRLFLVTVGKAIYDADEPQDGIENHAKIQRVGPLVWLAAIFQMTSPVAFPQTNTNVHTSWMWHMHQPIYWPDKAPENHPTLGSPSTVDHYQNAWDTIQLDDARLHPSRATRA
jgi:hypothetical protein